MIMKKKIVNLFLLERLLAPMGHLPDEEELVFYDLNPNDEHAVKEMIRKYVVPAYFSFGPKSKEISKNSLQYFLSMPKSSYQYTFDRIGTPFDSPEEPRKFFIWVWQELFGEEDFSLIDKENYVVQNDEHAPNLAHIL